MTRPKVFAACGVLVVLCGTLGVTAATSGAAVTVVDVGNDSVQCDRVTGKITFPAPLFAEGTAPSATAEVKLKISDCADDSQPSLFVTGATVTGTLTLASNDCANLFSGLSSWVGDLTAKWKTASGTKLLVSTSTIHLAEMSGGVFGSGVPTDDKTTWSGHYGLLQVGTDPVQGATAAPSVLGSFTGGNGGVDSIIDFTTNETDNNLETACASIKGLTKITAGIGSITVG